MKTLATAVACAFLLTMVASAQRKPAASPAINASVLEAKIRKLWGDFKNKNKESFAVALDDNFRTVEEGAGGFTDKKADIASVDELELISYTLKDFTVKSLGPSTALVTYVVHYESKSGAQVAKADSIFGEVWVHEGNDWKALYEQETYIPPPAAK